VNVFKFRAKERKKQQQLKSIVDGSKQ